jgi:hypothetical protein
MATIRGMMCWCPTTGCDKSHDKYCKFMHPNEAM